MIALYLLEVFKDLQNLQIHLIAVSFREDSSDRQTAVESFKELKELDVNNQLTLIISDRNYLEVK